MRAYPRSKRLAVLVARDAGNSTQQVAEKYGVSESWVRRVVQQRRECGKCGPYKYRFRDRHSGTNFRRARYMVMEDPRITIKELERVLGTKLSIDFLGGLKDQLDINHNIRWYGGLDMEFVLSPSGNYLTQPRQPAFPWDLEQELERLKRGEPAAEQRVFGKYRREYSIDIDKFPML